MFEDYFGMEHTPFVRNVPPEDLYESEAFRETLGRLAYAADRQMFAVVTADSGCGKSTLVQSILTRQCGVHSDYSLYNYNIEAQKNTSIKLIYLIKK